jgi:broad specificity phosphatase PhoE
MPKPAILTIVRHGQTAANLERVWHGSIDTPLTEAGREQARRVALWLAAHQRETAALYASPLTRALHTARAIAAALAREVREEKDLTEFCLGDWEGRRYSDLHRNEHMWERMSQDPDYAPPGGESQRRVATRIVGALRRIAAAHPGERVIAVSHGGAMTLGLGLLLDGVANSWTRVLENCSVSELVLEPEPQLLSFNRVEHLDGE